MRIASVLNAREDDVLLGTLPLFHAFGLTVTSLLPLVEGIPLVCHPDPTNASDIGKLCAQVPGDNFVRYLNLFTAL